jgi:hypothetical protein
VAVNPALDELLSLDVPDCTCRRPSVPFCLIAFPVDLPDRPIAGCRTRAETGTCECADWIQPCEHVVKSEDPFWDLYWASAFMEDDAEDSILIVMEWAERLLAADPAAYGRPPVINVGAAGNGSGKRRKRIPEWALPMVAQGTYPRVDAMTNRVAAKYHLWRTGDRRPGGIGEVYVPWERLNNGEDRQVGLKLHDPNAPIDEQPAKAKKRKTGYIEPPEAAVPWAHPVWDKAARQRLFHVNRVIDKNRKESAA